MEHIRKEWQILLNYYENSKRINKAYANLKANIQSEFLISKKYYEKVLHNIKNTFDKIIKMVQGYEEHIIDRITSEYSHWNKENEQLMKICESNLSITKNLTSINEKLKELDKISFLSWINENYDQMNQSAFQI